MARSAQLEDVKNRWRAFVQRAQALGPMDGFRLAYEELTAPFPPADDVQIERVNAGGVPVEWIAAPGAAHDRVVFYLHGGGYILGSMKTHRGIISRVARAAGARALGVDYRLAPEHPFPAAIDDAVAAYRWLLSTGVDPKKVVFCGDSCGGGFAVATMVALRYFGEPLPAAAVGMSSWADMTLTAESYTSRSALDPVVQRGLLDFMAEQYLGKRDRRTPLASPVFADLQGLPPLLLHAGSDETMHDDTPLLARRAQDAGVSATVEIWDDMPHVWHLFAPILPEGQQALDRIGKFMREHTEQASSRS